MTKTEYTIDSGEGNIDEMIRFFSDNGYPVCIKKTFKSKDEMQEWTIIIVDSERVFR